MSKDLSDRYYEKKQKQKKDSKKSLVKGIKIFLKGKKNQSKNIAVIHIRIFQKMKSKI